MKWLSALILTGLLTMGCRSSQPATNPFLRTTVPPPATGGAVVVQGEPYVPGAPVAAPAVGAPMAAPQVIAPTVPTTPQPYTPAPMTPFTPAAPPPGAVSPPIVAPPVVAPVPAAPPMVAPPKDKYSPPGGSFQYNQSSVQPTGPQGVVPAGYQAPGSPRLRAAIASWTAAQPAPAAAETKPEAPAETSPPASAPAPVKTVQPASIAVSSGKPGSQIRIGGTKTVASKSETAKAAPAKTPAAPQPAEPPIDPEAARVVEEVNRQQRQAAGNAAFKEVSRAVTPSGPSQLAIITTDTLSDATERYSVAPR
jgi:hypothetical protein